MALMYSSANGYLPPDEIDGPPSLSAALASAFRTNSELCLALLISTSQRYFTYRICTLNDTGAPPPEDMIDLAKETEKACEAMEEMNRGEGSALFLMSREMFTVMHHARMFDGLDAAVKKSYERHDTNKKRGELPPVSLQ